MLRVACGWPRRWWPLNVSTKQPRRIRPRFHWALEPTPVADWRTSKKLSAATRRVLANAPAMSNCSWTSSADDPQKGPRSKDRPFDDLFLEMVRQRRRHAYIDQHPRDVDSGSGDGRDPLHR